MSNEPAASATTAFPIVGVGAAAGGLEAFTQLLQCLPPSIGFGLVLIQHVDRSHPSLPRDAVAKATTLPVHPAEHGMRVEPGHVYVIAPNTDLKMVAGQLVVTPRSTEGVRYDLPVDSFLCSLALDIGSRAIGVILSGSASDGTDGLRAIRARGGITFAQDPRCAKLAGMPQSAIDAGVVDHCLDIPHLADELVSSSREQRPVHQELSTLNDELRSRNDEVTRVNNDLLNLALTADIAMLTLDLQRRIRRFTPKAHSVFHLRASDVGRPIEEIRLKIDVRDLCEQIGEVLEHGGVKESEVRDEDGHWYRMQIRPYQAAERIDGAIVSLVDIDHLKRLVADAQSARSEAERANRAKDDFLAVLSHELRTPLSTILLNAQRLRSGDPLDRAGLERVGEALERATALQAKLIDDLLDVSRIAAGKLTLDFRPVDLGAVVRETLAFMDSRLDAKGLELRVSLESAIHPIWADEVRVQQVVSNLLGNAIKFTPRGGRVTIVVDAAGHFGRFRIDDTGKGIEADFLPHVFNRFSQSDSSTTRTHGGLGLGLALVRQLVELQGGTSHAQSEGPGQGASFTVTFPHARASDRARIASPPTAAGRAQPLDRPGRTRHYEELKDLRVLFIDDDRGTREAIFEVLQLAGARVELAASAAAGMAAIEHFKPRVIVCDIAMPDESGYEFIRKLRAREAGATEAIPALALTALASSDDRLTALAAGFQLHMAKPIDIDRLRDAVLELSRWTWLDA